MKSLIAGEIADKLQKLIDVDQLNEDEILKSFVALRKKTTNNIFKMIGNGLRSAKNKSPTPLELRIAKLLEENGIEFELHANVDGIKKPFNVDFAIPNELKPKVIIEAATCNPKTRLRTNLRNKVEIIDHRFQHLKMLHKDVVTILCLELPGVIVNEITFRQMKERVSMFLLNTDIFLLNHEIESLPTRIEEIIRTTPAFHVGRPFVS